MASYCYAVFNDYSVKEYDHVRRELDVLFWVRLNKLIRPGTNYDRIDITYEFYNHEGIPGDPKFIFNKNSWDIEEIDNFGGKLKVRVKDPSGEIKCILIGASEKYEKNFPKLHQTFYNEISGYANWQQLILADLEDLLFY